MACGILRGRPVWYFFSICHEAEPHEAHVEGCSCGELIYVTSHVCPHLKHRHEPIMVRELTGTSIYASFAISGLCRFLMRRAIPSFSFLLSSMILFRKSTTCWHISAAAGVFAGWYVLWLPMIYPNNLEFNHIRFLLVFGWTLKLNNGHLIPYPWLCRYCAACNAKCQTVVIFSRNGKVKEAYVQNVKPVTSSHLKLKSRG